MFTATPIKSSTARFVFWLVLMACSGPLLAQNQKATVDSQFLFALDTSSSMSRLSRSALDSISNLVSSGIQGQVQPGDAIRVWTFNETLSTNSFGPVNWDPPLNLAIAKSILKHLKSQKFEKKTRYDPLWNALKQAARQADSLTAIIVTDGDDTVNGTPFDKALNDVFLKYGKELRKMRKPFLVTMQSREGQFLACNVCAAGVSIPFDELAQQIAKSLPPKSRESVTSPPDIAPPPDIKPAIPVANVTNLPPATTNSSSTVSLPIPDAATPSQATTNVTIEKPAISASVAVVTPEIATNIASSKIAPATNQSPTELQEKETTSAGATNTPIPEMEAPPMQAKTTNAPSVVESNLTSSPQTNANSRKKTLGESEKITAPIVRQTNTDVLAKTNIVSGFRPKPSPTTQATQSVAIAKTIARPITNSTAKPKAIASKTGTATLPSTGVNSMKPAYLVIGCIVLFALLAGIVLTLRLIRLRRAAPQSSFISRGIERHLR